MIVVASSAPRPCNGVCNRGVQPRLSGSEMPVMGSEREPPRRGPGAASAGVEARGPGPGRRSLTSRLPGRATRGESNEGEPIEEGEHGA